MADLPQGTPVTAAMKTSLSAICPACSEGEFGIRHEPGRYGPWHCRVCGARWLFDIDMPEVQMTRVTPDDVPGWLVLRIGESDPATCAVIDHPFYAHSANDTPEEQSEHTRFWVEESTCPTNLIPVEALVVGDDADPHHLLTFVGHVRKADWPGRDRPDAGWVALIAAVVAANDAREPD